MCEISVILPTYNVEKHIKKCICSILNQTFQKFELIVVNDESTDNTISVVSEIKDSRIRIINQENKGAAQARRTGVEQARSEYIMFVDPDDYIESTMLEELYTIAIEKKVDIVSCEYFHEDNLGRAIRNVKKHKTMEYSSETAIKAIHDMSAVYEFMWNKLYRKQVLLLDEFPEKFFTCEDYCFITSIIAKQNLKIYHFGKNLYHYVIHGTNMTKSGFNQRFVLSHVMWRQKMYELIELFPTCKLSIRNYNVLQNMAVLNAMFRSGDYDEIIFEECRVFIKRNALGFVFSPYMSVLHKGAAIVLCINVNLYKCIYLNLLLK